MEIITVITNWIVENEGLLSGIAALIVVGGVLISPFGASFRSVVAKHAPFLFNDDNPLADSSGLESTNENGSALSNRQRPAIAILPLNNMSGDAAQDYLADGLTEDLITLVSRLDGFDVIARNSTFAYKGQHPDIREVGRTLGASYVVEGSIRRIGNQIRVTVQLIDAADGNHVWAEKYDRPVDEFFDLQDEVVAAIAAQLHPQLNTAAIARHLEHSEGLLKAWALTRQAFSILRSERNNKINLDRAIALCEQALDLAPDYTDAYGALARAHAIACYYAETDDGEKSIERAQEAIAILRRLAPNEAVTFHAIAQLALATDGSAKAVPAFEEAAKRNPNDVLLLASLGYHLVHCGRGEEGIAKLQRALDLSPHDPGRHRLHFLMAMALLNENEISEALGHARASVELFDEFPAALALYAGLLFAQDHKEEAKQQLARLRSLSPNITREILAQRIGYNMGLKIEHEASFNRLLDEAGFDSEDSSTAP